MANRPILSRHGVLLAVVESTYGSEETPSVNGNSMLCWDVEIGDDTTISAPEYLRPYAGEQYATVGTQFGTLKLKHALVGSGCDSDVLLPAFDALWQAAKLDRTDTGSPVTSRAWSPKTLKWVGATIYVYRYNADGTSGNLYKFTGFQGSWKLMLSTDEPYGIVEISGEGLYNVVTEATPPTPNYYESAPPSLTGLTTTFQTKAIDFRSVTVEVPIGITPLKALGPSGTTGRSGQIGHLGDVQVEVQTTALVEGGVNLPEYTFHAVRDAGTQQVVSVTGIGSSAGNTWSLVISRFLMKSIDEGDDSGTGLLTIKGVAQVSAAGDDAFVLTLS